MLERVLRPSTASEDNGTITARAIKETALTWLRKERYLKTRTIEITFESSEVLVIKHRGKLAKAWCPLCGKQVGMISTQEAGEAGLTREAICKWAEEGQLHLIEPGGGLSFVCLNSVVESLQADHPDKKRD